MRCSWASAARVFTLFTLTFFASQSLLLANAEASSSVSSTTAEQSTSTSTVPTGTSTSVSSTTTTTTTTSTTSSTTSVNTSKPTSTSSSSTRTSSSSTSTSKTSTSTPTSTAPSAFSARTSSTSSTAISSSETSSTSTSSSSSSSTSSTSSSSTSTGVTLISSTSPLSPPASTDAPTTDGSTSTYTWLTSNTASATDGASNASSAHTKSFFDNKGAVAGTFSVVGLVAVGGILLAIMWAKRRAARLQDEEDMTYFEKYEAPNNNSATDFHSGTHSPADPEMSFVGGSAPAIDVNDEPLATHAAADAYPDRAMHYGLPAMDEYSQPSEMGLNFSNAGVDYPPGMSYNAAQYDPTQYAGYDGGYGAVSQPPMEQAYYEQPARSPASPSHPYANPMLSPRMTSAPPVQQQPTYYGEAR